MESIGLLKVFYPETIDVYDQKTYQELNGTSWV